MRTEKHPNMVLVVSLVALVIASAFALFFGATSISVHDVLARADARMVLLELRLPRVLFGIVVGGALALVGAAYQTLFRNSLASPFTLGVSSGAALGAALSLMTASSVFGVASSAMLGALVSIALILLMSRRMGVAAGDSLLLVGIVFSFFCSSILTMLQYLSDYSQLFRVTRWMMGGIPAASVSDLALGAGLVLILFVWLSVSYRDFDLMLFGDEVATVKGASVRRLYYVTFVLSSLVVGWIVSQCGVIGFVGIVVPAVARLLVGLRHKYVVPLSFVLGALLVVLCDLLGRIARPPFEVPAGVFTAIVGGPVFILLAIATLHARR
jgi:iron complex transport system permease protein